MPLPDAQCQPNVNIFFFFVPTLQSFGQVQIQVGMVLEVAGELPPPKKKKYLSQRQNFENETKMSFNNFFQHEPP